jgi:hypothetical protein
LAREKAKKFVEFRRWLKSLEPYLMERAERLLKETTDPVLAWKMVNECWDRLYGKATQPIELTERQKEFREMTGWELVKALRAQADALEAQLREQAGAEIPVAPVVQ